MDPELFKRMQDAAARFNAGESDFEEIMTPAGPAHLVRDANDPRGFRLDFVGEGSKHTVPVQEYPATPSRPPGYPAPLPFLPGCRAIVNTIDQSVTFVDPADAGEALDALRRQMSDDGWVLQDLAGSEEAPVFEKEGAERTVEVNADFGVPRLVVRELRPPPTHT